MFISRTTTTDLIVSSKIKFVSQPHYILYFYFIRCYYPIPTFPTRNTLSSPALIRVKNANDCKRSIFLGGKGGGGEEGADGRALAIINRSESPHS